MNHFTILSWPKKFNVDTTKAHITRKKLTEDQQRKFFRSLDGVLIKCLY